MAKIKTQSKISKLKLDIATKFSENKIRIIILSLIVFACFITGIILYSSNPYYFPGDEYLLSFNGAGNGFSAFFSRTFSLLVVSGLIFVFSLTKWTFPIGVSIIGFRGYLLGFNISALCSSFGMSGLLDAVLIILPIQLCMLLAFIFMFVFFTKARLYACGYGRNNRLKTFSIFFGILILLNIAETCLLFIFSSNVILVI